MVWSNFLKVHVDNFAPLEVFMEKGANNILSLGNCGEEFSFKDFRISSCAKCFVFLILLILFLHLSKSLLFKLSHELLFFLVHVVKIVVFLFFHLFFIILPDSLLMFSLHFFLLFLELLSFVSDCLGNSKFLIDLMGKAHIIELIHC